MDNILEIKDDSLTEQVKETDVQQTDNIGQNTHKLFTQKEVEALISERMKRERKNARSLNSLKEMLNKLKDSGVITPGSYSDMASQLSVRLGGIDGYAEGDAPMCGDENVSLQEQSKGTEEGIVKSESLEVSENNEAEDGNAQISSAAVGQADFEKARVTANELIKLKEEFPEADLNDILKDGAFFEYASGKKGNICELYGQYLCFVDSICQHGSSKLKRQPYRDAGATGFSGHSKAGVFDYSSRLTRRQMDMADSCGMSYREYGELLSGIPASKAKGMSINN